MNKTCTKCGEEKPLELFWKRSNRPNGYRSACISCSSAYHSKWHFKNKNSVKKRSICTRYSLSSEQYDQMMSIGCYSCGSFEDLCVDHDHSCCAGPHSCGLCVRGVLCRDCNGAEGWLRGNPQKARQLAEYMERFINE